MPKFYGVGPWGVSYETQQETDRTISVGKRCSRCGRNLSGSEFYKELKKLADRAEKIGQTF